MIYLMHDLDLRQNTIQKRDLEKLLDELQDEIDERESIIAEYDDDEEGTEVSTSDYETACEELKELQDHDAFELTDTLGYHGDVLIHEHYFEGYVREIVEGNCTIPRELENYIDWEDYAEDQESNYAHIGDYYVSA